MIDSRSCPGCASSNHSSRSATELFLCPCFIKCTARHASVQAAWPARRFKSRHRSCAELSCLATSRQWCKHVPCARMPLAGAAACGLTGPQLIILPRSCSTMKRPPTCERAVDTQGACALDYVGVAHSDIQPGPAASDRGLRGLPPWGCCLGCLIFPCCS